MQTAPEGLTRDQFFALIDKELAAGPEPDTFWGGVRRSLGETFSGGLDAPIVHDIANAAKNVGRGFLPKPYSGRTLLETVQTALI